MKRSRPCSRRDFLGTAAAAGAVGAGVPMFVPQLGAGRTEPARRQRPHPTRPDRRRRHGHGQPEDLREVPDVAITAICDVWKQKRDALAAKFTEARRRTTTTASCSSRRTSTR